MRFLAGLLAMTQILTLIGIPPIDKTVPEKIETATFAMG